MSERDKPEITGSDQPDIELETKRLMDEAMGKIPTAESSEPEEKPTEQIDATFQRLQARMEDLLSTIEDALKSVGPDLDAKTAEIYASLSKKLANAGLGVFATGAAKIVKDELESELAVHEAIAKSRTTIADAIEKTAKGAVRNVGQTSGNLQAKLLQMYAKLSEMDKQLETARGEVRKWRGKSSELEERMRQREDLMSQSSEEMIRMHENIKDLTNQLQEKDVTISELKGEVGQAQSQAAQQQEMLKALDSAEQVATDYESKVLELSQVQGQLAQITEQLGQKDAEISVLRSDVELLKQDKAEAVSLLSDQSDKLASLTGSEMDYQAEVDEMNAKVAELQARWDTLYRVA